MTSPVLVTLLNEEGVCVGGPGAEAPLVNERNKLQSTGLWDHSPVRVVVRENAVVNAVKMSVSQSGGKNIVSKALKANREEMRQV